MTENESFRIATAELIGFGTVGTILDAAYEVLINLDVDLAAQLDFISSQVLERFDAAERLLFSVGSEE